MNSVFKAIKTMSKKLTDKAQSIGEYALFLGVVVAALIAMQIPVRWAIQGRAKDLIKNFKDFELPGNSISEFSKDLGSNSESLYNSRENVSLGMKSGAKAVKRILTESQQTTSNQVYEGYQDVAEE